MWAEAYKLSLQSVEVAVRYFLDDETQKWYASGVMKGDGRVVPEYCAGELWAQTWLIG
jgi:hypothetical protein